MGRLNLCACFIFSLVLGCYGNKCPINNSQTDCPGPDDPYDLAECCVQENFTKYYCCVDLNMDNRLLVKISMSVTLICILVSILLVVCCFWSRCPLFDWCWVNYTERGNIAYMKEEENQPPDEHDYTHEYVPLNVKVNQIEDV